MANHTFYLTHEDGTKLMRKYEPPREGWTITYITTDIKYIMWYCWKWCSQSVTMHQNENAQPSTLNFENFSRRCLEPPHCGKATLAATQIITPNPLVSSVIRDQVYYLVVFLESSLDSVYLEPRERVRWLQMLFYFCWTKPENWNLLEIFKIFFRWCINTQNTLVKAAVTCEFSMKIECRLFLSGD